MNAFKYLLRLLNYAIIVASLFAALSALPIGRWGWLFELAVQFVPQLIFLSAALLGLNLLLRRKRISALLLISLIVNSAHVYLAMDFKRIQHERGGAIVTLAWLNLQESTDALDRFAALNDGIQRDVIAFTELPSSVSENDLNVLFPGMHAQLFTDTGYGKRLSSNMADLVRDETAAIQLFSNPDFTKRAFIVVDLSTQTGPLRMIAAHPTPPGSPADMADRNSLLSRMTATASATDRFVLMGDFNVTPWSPVFRSLPGRRVGNPFWTPTWHSGAPGLSLPIDHLVISDGIEAVSYSVGQDVGSDHRPLTAALEVFSR